MLLDEICDDIRPVSVSALEMAWSRLDNLTKPRRSLGRLEETAARIAAIRGVERPSLGRRAVFVFVGDHDVVDEGVSAYPQEVTALMVKNFLAGGAAINVLSRAVGAEVHVVDVGMKEDPGEDTRLIRRNVKRSASNIARGPAMKTDEAVRAVGVGLEMAERAHKEGVGMVATGEMGIGNTTPAAAVMAALLPADPAHVTGRGTGIEDSALARKISVIRRALDVNKEALSDPLSVLAAVGGLEIAAITGLCLGGALRGMAVVVDGFISGAGALAAMRICPRAADYMFFSHVSQEAGHRVFCDMEGIRPILDLDMRLGEGTGAVLAMHLMDAAVKIYNEMATFADVGIAPR